MMDILSPMDRNTPVNTVSFCLVSNLKIERNDRSQTMHTRASFSVFLLPNGHYEISTFHIPFTFWIFS